MKDRILNEIDKLIVKVWKETNEDETYMNSLDKMHWQEKKLVRSKIFGRKSVQIDIENLRKTLEDDLK